MKRLLRSLPFLAVAIALLPFGACKKEASTSEASIDDAPLTAQRVGVARCDEYLAKYDKCLADKVPSESRKALKRKAILERSHWLGLVAHPSTKSLAGEACRRAIEKNKASMASFGCSW
jgi:hypothetical protein